MTTSTLEKYKGCLLAGGAGDALGAPVEFESLDEIISTYGEQGITDYDVAYGKLGAITDDTQLTLFTAEGLLRALVRSARKGICCVTSVVSHSYLRWLSTQHRAPTAPHIKLDGFLYAIPEMHAVRAPGATCLSSLSAMVAFGNQAHNKSKGCGAVMRVAPIGMLGYTERTGYQWVIESAIAISGLTHGHPTGKITSAFLAVLIYCLMEGTDLDEAISVAMIQIEGITDAGETLAAIEQALDLAQRDPSGKSLAQLGQGWVAEEALSIAVYCSLVGSSLEEAVVLAVNHDGDSDSTGSITGQIRGAMEGVSAIPGRWLSNLELRETLEAVADDLYSFDPECDEAWIRYPGY